MRGSFLPHECSPLDMPVANGVSFPVLLHGNINQEPGAVSPAGTQGARMATRFGRRAADGSFEYHDSKESLAASERRENSDARAGLFGLIGLLVGGVLTYVVLLKVGMDWPKWLRFGLVIAGGGTLAYVLAKFADLIWNIILTIVLLAVLWGIGSMIWKAV